MGRRQPGVCPLGYPLKIRSALVRPLEPRYPTNLAVLILAPVAGLVFAGLALWHGHSVEAVLESALRGGLTAFAGWALAREIAPDDNPAAFVSLGLALLVAQLVPSGSVLLLLTAMMLARLVNRSVGIPATLPDSAALTLLVSWAAYSTRNGAPAVIAAIAFGLDASLSTPLRRQWSFAFIGLAGGLAVMLLRDPVGSADAAVAWYWTVGTIALLYAFAVLRTRRVRSVADRTGEPLSVNRVRAGMAVAWLMAVQGLLGDRALTQSSLIWAVLTALLVRLPFRRVHSWRRPLLPS